MSSAAAVSVLTVPLRCRSWKQKNFGSFAKDLEPPTMACTPGFIGQRLKSASFNDPMLPRPRLGTTHKMNADKRWVTDIARVPEVRACKLTV